MNLQKGSNMKNLLKTVRYAFLTVLLISLTAAVLAGIMKLVWPDSGTLPRYESWTEDYTKTYAYELKEIFGDYRLSQRRDWHTISEDGLITRDYYDWQITYHDACGRQMKCIFNNYESLPAQQFGWLQDQIEKHIYDEYIIPFFSDMIEPDNRHKTYCSCSIGRVCNTWSTEHPEWRAHLDTCSAYQKRLMKSEPPVPLYQLGYKELFDRYPIRLNIQITLNYSAYSREDWKQKAGEQLRLMAAAMVKDVGENLNLSVDVRRSVASNENISVYYLLGRETETQWPDFGHAVYEAYIGKYW